jgi:hypothetical protein
MRIAAGGNPKQASQIEGASQLKQPWRLSYVHKTFFCVVPPIAVSSIVTGAFCLLQSNGFE